MSDTPQTDAHSPASYAIIRPDGVRTDYVPADFARKLERERDKYRRAVELIAEDCEAWLNSESDEPSADFIKLVAKYAREVLQ
jgi:hypothetical protein